jgi:hypothetical protein
MFGDSFAHYLSYGASDQETVRLLRGSYDGLLVPGTVAAFQKEGTGGFVLSLSASGSGTPYVIDPRFPLFQQPIAVPKKSHDSLAAILGLPDSAEERGTTPAWFTTERLEAIAESWARFNCSYQDALGGKFEKYAKRLGEELKQEHAAGPLLVLAPYFVALNDEWWRLSCDLYDATARHVSALAPGKMCVQVVAVESPHELERRLPEVGDVAAIWVSDLNELRAAASEDRARLVEYGRAIDDARRRNQRLFALYGGFFAVLLGNVGLGGLSHGIGYGESRAWEELPQSGPPPARYYLPELHRYVSVELAFNLWRGDVSRCACPVCNEEAPVFLEYHDLMKHSVYTRAREIKEWSALGAADAAARLTSERKEFIDKLRQSTLPDIAKEDAMNAARHLAGWIAVVQSLAS